MIKQFSFFRIKIHSLGIRSVGTFEETECSILETLRKNYGLSFSFPASFSLSLKTK